MPAQPTRTSSRPRRTAVRRRLLAVAALLAAFVAAAPAQAAGPHRDSTGAAGHDAKPTVVLVHGAWADGGSWGKVVTRLQRLGYPVRVPPNPLRSLPGDSATIAGFLATIPGPVVLVGRSYGGAVITNAATGNPAVKALVYVNAFAPDEGETVLPLAGPDSALAVDPTTVFDFVPYPGAPARQAAALYATQRPITASAGNQQSGVPAWKTIPSWYVLGTQDLIIPPSAQRFMATRAGSTIVKVRAGHLAPVSDPKDVTNVIVQAARATG